MLARIAGIAGILSLSLLALAPASAEVTVAELTCLPNETNQTLTAKITGVEGGDTVRAYFRRLNPSGAHYFVVMNPVGDGNYWVVLPRPEEREQESLTDEWWEILEDRDWVAGRDRDEIEDLFDEQEFEAAEYFVAVYDAFGERRDGQRSEDLFVSVTERDDCPVELTPIEVGFSRNLTIGETTREQVGKPVYHWLCDGIVTRLGASGILRPDDFCRSCVLAGWFPSVAAAGALTSGSTVHFREPRRASDIDR